MADAQPDAIAFLKADHRKVEDLFEKTKQCLADARKRVAPVPRLITGTIPPRNGPVPDR